METLDPTVARQIARAASICQQQRTGHAPQSVAVIHSGDTPLITAHGALSAAEKALAQRSSGATQARECHRQLFTNSADTPRQESKRITRIEASEATAEVETMTGTGVQVLSTGTMVHVFLVAPHVPANSWSGNGGGDPC